MSNPITPTEAAPKATENSVPNAPPASSSEGPSVDLSWHNIVYTVMVDPPAAPSPATVDDGNNNNSNNNNKNNNDDAAPKEVSASKPEKDNASSPPPKGKVPKQLIKNGSGAARGGRLTAIMGPSGAGKTTLLNAIAGRLAFNDSDLILDGTAYVNSSVFLAKYKPMISFVTQDDICMFKDTPRDAFYFSYRVRTGAPEEECNAVVEKMLEKLTLTGCADTILGQPGIDKGVSGGEKKRVNIGCELINNPRILILDEPTTGLDSVNAERVGKLLANLAHEDGRTVITTIHVPSSELFALFDDICLLSRGHTIYHGPREDAPAYFAALGFPVPKRQNPSEHYMKVLQQDPATVEALAKRWRIHATLNLALPDDDPKRNGCIPRVPENPTLGSPDMDAFAAKAEKQSSAPLEFKLLAGRSFRNTLRDPPATVGRVVQILIFSLFLGLFYFGLDKSDAGVQDRLGAIFFMALNMVFLFIMPALAMFPPERQVFLHEQQGSGAYNPIFYYFAKLMTDFPLLLLLPTIYASITYWMWGLVGEADVFFTALLLILLTANCSNAFGFLCAAAFPNPQIAMTITPLLIMPLFLTAGLFANTDRLEPGWMWLTWIGFPRYSFKGLLRNEFLNIGEICSGPSCRFHNGNEVVNFYGFEKESDRWEWCALALVILNIIFRILGAMSLGIQAKLQQQRMKFDDNFQHGQRAEPANEQDDGTYDKKQASEAFALQYKMADDYGHSNLGGGGSHIGGRGDIAMMDHDAMPEPQPISDAPLVAVRTAEPATFGEVQNENKSDNDESDKGTGDNSSPPNTVSPTEPANQDN